MTAERALRIWAVTVLPLAVAYFATVSWVVERWESPSGYYQHGWLLPFVGLVLLWQRTKLDAEVRRAVMHWTVVGTITIAYGAIAAVPAFVVLGLTAFALAGIAMLGAGRACRVDRRALWLLVPGVLVHVAGALLTIDSLSATSLVLVVPGVLWFALGPDALRGRWPLLLLVGFAIPMPMYVEGRVGFVLKEFAVSGGAALANMLGAGVTRNGADLLVAGQERSLFVAEACGGLRSLLAMITLGYCLAFFLGARSWLRRALLLLVTVPMAIFANVVRIATLCVMASVFGVDFAEGTGHTIANIGEWGADVGSLLLLDWLFTRLLSRRRGTGTDPQPAVPPEAVAAAPGRAFTITAIVLWLLTGPLLWLSYYRPPASGGSRAAQLPEDLAGYRYVPRAADKEAEFRAALPRYVELLGTDDFVWREYRNDAGNRIFVVALFHDTNWKSVHPPRICIEGSDMDIEIDDHHAASWLGDDVVLSRIVARSHIDNWQYLTLSVFGTDAWASGVYSDFTWHHLPRALLRQSQSGFLLRVETPVTPGEALDVAADRCDGFLRALVPAARSLLR